jgi:hypothetical protein
MRIAVSGTHGVGKSTLIDAFLSQHQEFVYEPEPYTVLMEDLGEEFAAEPCVEDFQRQLAFNIERLGQHKADENVIYERCPIDFLAYIAALDQKSAIALVESVSEAMQHLDLIVYLPFDGTSKADEYPKLQRAVDGKLISFFREGEFDITSSTNVIVVEAEGTTAQRLRVLEQSMNIKHAAG